MSMTVERLLIRRPGDTDWVPVDPDTPMGRLALERLEFTINPEGTVDMTTTAARINGSATPARTYVPGTPPGEQPGFISQAKGFFVSAKDTVVGAARSAWGWLRRTLHLDSAVEVVQDSYGWAKSKVTTATRFLGTSGTVGVGMLAVSTSTGRGILRLAFKPIAWLLGRLGAGYATLEAALVDSRFAPLSWMGHQMANARIWAFGNPANDEDHGVFGRSLLWGAKHIGPRLHLESRAMRATRVLGMVLVAAKVIPLLSMLPVLAGLAQVLAWTLVVETAAATFRPEIETVMDKMGVGIKKADKAIEGVLVDAEKIVEETRQEIHTDINTAVHATAARVPVNRDTRRAAKKAGARR